MSVRHQICTVHILDKNFNWSTVDCPNDLAADAAVEAAMDDSNCLYAFEDFDQHDGYFDAIERHAKAGKRFYQIDQALEDEEN